MSRTVHRVVAISVLVYALVIYLLTVSPTASFWDSGEFIAIAHGLQVSHPPGAPLYMLIGRFFSMFVPDAYVSLAVNMVSVVSSAVTILLTHLVIVRLVQHWQTGGEVGAAGVRTRLDDVVALAGGVVGACAFAVTDSFWFNAVEAEVYAGSMLFTALVVWLILRWSAIARVEEAQFKESGNHPFGLQANRYLILIAYLFGLAIGMHLLNLLAVFFVALIFFFTEYERPTWSTTTRVLGLIAAAGVASVVFLSIYPGIIQWLPDLAQRVSTDITPFETLREEGFGVLLMEAVSRILRPLFVLFGSYGAFVFMLSVFALVIWGVWWSHTRQKQVFNLVMLCVTAVLIGYSTYGVIFIRSAANPPIDENDPETAEAIVSYLKREQYGATPRLPRMWSEDPNHQAVYARYDSEMEFFLGYQVNYMYWRYFLWQFMGRDSDEQGASAITGIDAIDDVIVDNRKVFFQTPSERASRNGYYALPLLLGLFGMIYHAVRDPRRAFAVFVLFFITGIGIILYLNQTPLQPRERDYSYVASFFAFSLWIGIGASGLAEMAAGLVKGERGRMPAALGAAVAAFAAVPLVLLAENYDDHDRSGRYVAPDYAYNMLNSTQPNAILFTNGDNDTFPLWYAQEVEGIRRDVRVANLSLLQTPWYVKQLKNQASRQSAPLPMTMTDEQAESIGPVAWDPRPIALPVDSAAFAQGTEMQAMLPGADDPDARFVSPMVWELRGRQFAPERYYLGPNDLAILDLLRTNAQRGWERPIYFAVTVAPSGMLDLQPFFQLEGQANRVVPIRHDQPIGRVVPEITVANLMNFRFRGLDDPDVYFDDNIRAMVDNYRSIFAQTALALVDQGEERQARELLDFVLEKIPFETIPGDAQTFTSLARAYIGAGAPDQAAQVLARGEEYILAELDAALEGFGAPGGQRAFEFALQSAQIMQLHYVGARAFDRAAALSDRMAAALGDPSYSASAEEMEQQYDFVIRQLGFGPEAQPAETES